MSSDNQLTPMMAQYRRIKGSVPRDALLLFRLGDFYEMFFEDAITGSRLLNLALTKRNGVPMCGLPFHAAGAYIGKLLKAGYKVAICEQLEDAKPGKLVRREVTQIISPGTHFDERMLQAERNNYLAGIAHNGKTIGLSALDLTTGTFKCSELYDYQSLMTELERLRPAEIIIPQDDLKLRRLLLTGKADASDEAIDNLKDLTTVATPFGWVLSGYEGWVFAPETAIHTILDHYKVLSLDGFGLKSRIAAACAAGGLLHYLTQNLKREVPHLNPPTYYSKNDYLALDAITLRHLEVLEPIQKDSSGKSTLYSVLNKTVTPMGARLLRDWLSQPLSDAEKIATRQDAVQTLFNLPQLRDELRKNLEEVRDIERTVSRLASGNGNARDLVSLGLALAKLPEIKSTLQQTILNIDNSLHTNELPLKIESLHCKEPKTPLLQEIYDRIVEEPDIIDLISKSIIDDPPVSLKDGGIIKDGFNSALDELRYAMRDGKDWIAKLQQQEIEKTGIQSLKIRFNSVFGYYIEVTKSNLDKVPSHYIRKQTIANGERYITEELKEVEGKILGAEERSKKLEYELFIQIRDQALAATKEILDTANALAQLDVLASFAEVAHLNNYCRPKIADEGIIDISEGRHPVLEQNLIGERFVPNDIKLGSDIQIAVITGPNMAGKSTYIRQVALLVLLAHTGSFVPATKARIDLVDRIFTRIGASDDISRGQSTFMVEMSETANILNNATQKSLVVLDEIGRGTSTFDGLSLAWSIIEYIHNVIGAKTLFATHYHELTELANKYKRIKNYNIAVREWNDQVVFLRKIVEGGCDKSYGIQVARLAGVPAPVIQRAKQILSNLEESELTPDGEVRTKQRRSPEREKLKKLTPPAQLDLFSM
ncbi:MAG: DNA mismatch repair protein MutS [Verrucomicrobiae bacterium]|nr:DNA mismatch repair protein MutS [Verrucomicrobiae bacterium]